jgi:hypothetical protein
MSACPLRRPGESTATATQNTASAAPASSYVLGADPPFWKARRTKPTPSVIETSKSRWYNENDLLERDIIAAGRAALAVVALVAAFLALAIMSNSMSVLRPRHVVATPRDLVSPTSAWPLQQQSLVIRHACIDRPEGTRPSWCPVTAARGGP